MLQYLSNDCEATTDSDHTTSCSTEIEHTLFTESESSAKKIHIDQLEQQSSFDHKSSSIASSGQRHLTSHCTAEKTPVSQFSTSKEGNFELPTQCFNHGTASEGYVEKTSTVENVGLKSTLISFHRFKKIRVGNSNRWSPYQVERRMMYSSMYKTAMSEIYIDHGEFQRNFMEKIGHLKSRSRFTFCCTPNLEATYERAKKHIIDMLTPFMRVIEEKARNSIKIKDGMYLEEFKFAHISNKEIFLELNKACSAIIKDLEEIESGPLPRYEDDAISGIIQKKVTLHNEGTSNSKFVKCKMPISLSCNLRNNIRGDVIELLKANLSDLPEKIMMALQSLPKQKIIEGYFSFFGNTCIDNTSLLKIKEAFDITKLKLIEREELAKFIEENCNSPYDNSNIDCDQSSRIDFAPMAKIILKLSKKLITDNLGKALRDNEHIMFINFNNLNNYENNRIFFANEGSRYNVIDQFSAYLTPLAADSCIKYFLKKYSKLKL